MTIVHSPKLEPWGWRSEKVLPKHLERWAVVYVRQSTVQQVLDHQESTRLQYGLVSRALALGWPESRVQVIDDDLGKSGTSTAGREGFARLVSEVGLDHVGLILGLEMSRLARSSKDWHQLLEICALFGTLIADLDGVYDPSQYNDRLLLGLKGTMSEAELHILKQRLHQGKLNKARRGELTFPLPIGYVRRPSGEVTLDPDEPVQQVVHLIFRKFDELGTLHALLRYLTQHDIRLGVRVREGAAKGELEWRRPNRMTLQSLLKHPAYAGAYTYGRRQVDPRRQQPGRPRTGRITCAPEDYHVLRKDHFPAYISWEQYERNLARLQANRARSEAMGAVRHGPALLAGLRVCGRCGARMFVRYGGPRKLHSYTCSRRATDYADDYCQYLPGHPLDAFISNSVLKALEPAALELSLQAAAHRESERAELDRLWQQRLERAAFEAERAARHYRLVEPENRLVARQLAKEWEAKLTAQEQLQEDYERFLHEQPRTLSEAERGTLRALAENLPVLWAAPTTTVAERKDLIREVIQRIRVENEGESERLHVSIDWVGGGCTTGVVTRPISRVERLSYYPELCERVRRLASQGLGAESIAENLAQAGYRPPKQAERFSRQAVRELLQRS
jgi:DNA invertase Pin-like site-specific DNA recombinase